MKSLSINLYSDCNDVSPTPLFEHFKYPAGEQQVRLTERGLKLVAGVSDVALIAQVNNAEDIVKLNLLCDAISRVQLDTVPDHLVAWVGIDLILPYLPASRADRQFCTGDCQGLKTYASLLGTAPGVRNVVTLDVHSDRAVPAYKQMFTKLIDVSPLPFIECAIRDIADGGKDVCVLFPDEGARQRYSLPELVGNNHSTIRLHTLHCSKKREPMSGKFLGFEVPDSLPDMPVLVVDDICDGGGTFVGIAEALTNELLKKDVKHKNGLYVSHGIFSKGLEPLLDYYDHIYTTNSHVGAIGHDNDRLTVYDCIPYLMENTRCQKAA